MTTLTYEQDRTYISPIGRCQHCYSRTIQEDEWDRMTAEQRASSGGRKGKANICNACERRSPDTLDPEPGSLYEEPVCVDCGHDMPHWSHWRKADDDEHLDMLADGYVIPDRHDLSRCKMCARTERLKHRKKRRQW